ncbi:PTPRB [Mytilus coruscus]|uniref:PTPRB n=1 Tax=Mytilus coruscus TaxID=42192 RepID=A0A6J8EGW7_MYTCO|nr:PTPRB [Mytilus coruscus]
MSLFIVGPRKAVITFLQTTSKTVSFNASFSGEDRNTGIYVSYVSRNGWNNTVKNAKMNPNPTYTISNLTAGTCYNFTFLSFLTENDEKSREATKTIHCTVPNPPLYVKVQHQSNTSVTLSIGSGTGNVDKYFVFIENVSMFETTQLENVEIVELEPGYQYIVNVWAISNGLNSTLCNVTIKTYPDSPLLLTVKEQTNTTFQVDVIHGRGSVQYFDVYISNTLQFRTNAAAGENTLISIKQLCPGNEYKTIEIKAVSHDLTSNSTELPPTATYPNPPSHVQVQNQSTTSVSLSIFNGTGNFDTYFVLIENVTFMEASYLENVEIENLDPGYQYIAQVGVKSNGLNSTVNFPINTYPDRPQSVDVINQTTESIGINITQGQGMVQFFFIRINNTYNVTGNQGQTAIILKNLIPGTLFTEMTVQAVSYELYGEMRHVMKTSTIPAAPRSAKVTNKTIDSLNITIAHGNGMVEFFFIQINGSTYQDQAAVESNTTEVKIPGLIPGTLYKNISIISVSNGLNGTLYEIPSCATYPDIPKSVDVTNQTITSVSLKIGHGTGVSKYFYIYVNGTLWLKKDVKGKTEVTSVVLSHLTPGTLYNVTVQTVSNNLSSEVKDAKPHATNPDVPTQIEVVNQSETTIELNICHGSGNVQWFEINLNDTYEYKIPPQKDAALTVYTIPNLVPGTCYRSIYIRSEAYGLQSIKRVVEPHSTNPAAPSKIICTAQTTDTINFDIVHGEGNVDYYIIQVNASYKVNTTANRSAVKTEITLDKLIPGIMYDQIKIQAFSNNLGSTTKNVSGYATNPPVPHFNIIGLGSSEINMTVVLHTVGHVDIYKASFESKEAQANCKSNSFTTELVNPTSAIVDNLTPGAKYEITVSTISNSLTSFSETKKTIVTKPSIPKFVVSDTSIHSITITITKGEGCVDHFEIYVDGRKKKNVPVSHTSNTITSVIDNLDDGKDFKINVLAVSYDTNSTRLLPLSDATNKNMVPVIGGAFGGVLTALAIVVLVVVWRKQLLCFRGKKPKDILDGRSNEGFDSAEVEMTDSRKKRPIKLSEFAARFEEKSRNTHMGFSSDFKVNHCSNSTNVIMASIYFETHIVRKANKSRIIVRLG